MFLRKLSKKLQISTRHILQIKAKSTAHLPNMESDMGLPLSEIVDKLTKFAPLNLAESWDNVGLLVDTMLPRPITNILLTNDLTESVVKEATEKSVGLIITYHPNIFQGMKRITRSTWKERIVIQCIRHDIAVFSPHTTWDNVKGGVNDWLAFPFDGEISNIKANAVNPEYGAGRLCALKDSLSVEDVVVKLKKHIGIPHLRLALAKDKNQSDRVSKIALCAGSGASILNGVDADLYLTGEMLHHDVLDAAQKGIHVILCNHSDSERGYLKWFQGTFQTDHLKDLVKVSISQVDKDPLETV